MAEGLARYQSTPPSDVTVLHDRQSLNDFVKANPETILYPENGGYYLKDMDEEVLAITADDLSKELDAAVASVDSDLLGNDSASDSSAGSGAAANVTKRNEDMPCYPNCQHNYCSHPRCFNSATCLHYSFCHVCLTSSRKVCI
ncbi:uncharacterized protein N7458_004285 [Penicillium daleae]|uniref:Uncharacterized protein n=1 Tax=Penicillium daleae TaxID=63821 RepID=A0AAD6G4U3_9EURO|nr:uncharacterized protein N7458_004285 [Penicillium daleae]KAJ5456021.1 hypothetical protein N7458_004285 [Penicillium daleae]